MTDHEVKATLHPVKGMQIKESNAVITGTFLGYANGIATFFIRLQQEDKVHDYGNWSLAAYDESLDEQVGTQAGMNLILDLLKTLELNCWEELTGKAIRIRTFGGEVTQLGHYLKNQWFDIKKTAQKFQPEDSNATG